MNAIHDMRDIAPTSRAHTRMRVDAGTTYGGSHLAEFRGVVMERVS